MCEGRAASVSGGLEAASDTCFSACVVETRAMVRKGRKKDRNGGKNIYILEEIEEFYRGKERRKKNVATKEGFRK